MKKCIVYCRVSTKEQSEKGYSLEAQRKECIKFTLNNDFEVDKIFIERGESAKSQNRTQLAKMLKYSALNKKKISALIIYKLDRLTRNLADLKDLEKIFTKLDIRILSATETNEQSPVGYFLRNFFGSLAQLDNDSKGERTILGMKQAVKEGRWCWPAPVGYSNAKDNTEKPILVKNEDSQYIEEAFLLAEKEIYKQTDIVNQLKKKGFKKINNSLLNRILRNPIYCGFIKTSWFPELIQGQHQPIISQEVFYKVQAILDGKKPSITPKKRNNPDFPLRNFIYCENCGGKLTGSWSKGRSKKYPYYHCRTKGCTLYVRKEKLEEEFYQCLKELQPKKEIIDLFEEIVLDVWKKRKEESFKELKRLEKEIKALKDKKERINELAIKRTFDDKTYKEEFQKVDNEIILKQLEFNEYKIDHNDSETCIHFCKNFIANIADLWRDADLDLKQRFQKLIFPENISYKKGSFRTAKIAFIFRHLKEKTSPDYCQAPPG
jgi:DNA invertase Pin-like site-specific DNA recombinase